MGFLGGSVVNNLPFTAGGAGNVGLSPRSGRFPGEGNGKLFQYSCLDNPLDKEPDGVIKSQTRLSTHVLASCYIV